MRVYQWYLDGVHPPPHSTLDHALPEHLHITTHATRFLRQQLELPGKTRGGMLFGISNGDTLEVHLATRLGHPATERDRVLEPDRGYALGVSEALSALGKGNWDWCGNWLSYPHVHLEGIRTDLNWLIRGARQGLVDEEHPLLVVGWLEGILTVRAYVLEFGSPLTPSSLRWRSLKVSEVTS